MLCCEKINLFTQTVNATVAKLTWSNVWYSHHK